MCYDFFMVSLMKHNGYQTLSKPGRLQELHTEIFRQLQLLIPDQMAHYDSFQSQVHGSPLLRMDILERHPYTHFVRLTYQFTREDSLEIAPDAHIRVYNDARLAEATSFDQIQGFNRQAPKKLNESPSRANGIPLNGSGNRLLPHAAWFQPFQTLKNSWQRNQALDKWLSYLLHQGHSLTSMRPASEKISGKQAKPVKEPSRST
jgi:uncharacterized protein YqiB (DUF1249 family)